jgi:GT2 family glycosyltransferase
MNKVDASIILPTWNRAQILEKTLPLFLAQDADFPFEVVVADDGSTDGTLQILKNFDSSMLKTLALPHRGISHARNRAVEAADGCILVFADDDCLVRPDFLRCHVQEHARRKNLALTGPIVNIEDIAAPLPTCRRFWQGWHRNPFPCCNCSLPKDIFMKAGGFWEAFTHYGWEDMEFWLRAKKAGAVSLFAPRAAVFHYKPKSQQKNLAMRISQERQRGRMGALFYSRHPKASVAFLVKKGLLLDIADILLNRAFNLEGLCCNIESGKLNPDILSGFMHRLLLLHSEISRANGRL